MKRRGLGWRPKFFSFEASAPNRKWIADFTYVWTAEGWLYVAAVVDLLVLRLFRAMNQHRGIGGQDNIQCEIVDQPPAISLTSFAI